MMNLSSRGTMAAMAAMACILICTPALGQAPAPATRSANPADEIVCEKQQVLGSRLQSKRVCRTRAEWADLRSQDRQDLEQRQTQKPMRGY